MSARDLHAAGTRAADFDAQVTGVAALNEPLRARLYRYVIAQADAVGRDQAAAALDVPRSVAAFHLDKLVAAGLLAVEFRRAPGRRGPGAGRPAKLYRRSGRQFQLSLPARDYELAGRVLAQAVQRSSIEDVPVGEAVADAATAMGRGLGTELRDRVGARAGPRLLRSTLFEVLTEHGYEPRPDGDRLTLANCPFDQLAREYTDLVCGMNLHVLGGLLAEVPDAGGTASLEPADGRCCVVLRFAS